MEISLRKNLIYAALIGELYFILILSIAYNLNSAFSYEVYFSNMSAVALSVLLPALSAFFMYLAYLGTCHVKLLFQYGKFILVGVLNTLIDIGIFNILAALIPGVSGILLSVFKAISFIASVTNSYIWNKHWVFRKEDAARKQSDLRLSEAAHFFIVSTGGFIVNLITFAAAIAFIGTVFSVSTIVAGNISALVAALASMVWNFTGYKFLVFKN